MKLLYLDTSALFKRYVERRGPFAGRRGQLAHVAGLAEDRGWRVENPDGTLRMEPRVASATPVEWLAGSAARASAHRPLPAEGNPIRRRCRHPTT